MTRDFIRVMCISSERVANPLLLHFPLYDLEAPLRPGIYCAYLTAMSCNIDGGFALVAPKELGKWRHANYPAGAPRPAGDPSPPHRRPRSCAGCSSRSSAYVRTGVLMYHHLCMFPKTMKLLAIGLKRTLAGRLYTR